MFYYSCKISISSAAVMEISCCYANKEQVLSSVPSLLCVFNPFSLDGDRFCSSAVLHMAEGRAKTQKKATAKDASLFLSLSGASPVFP